VTAEDDFQAALDRDPTDWQTRLVLADWLEEYGSSEQKYRALGYRALGACRRVPVQVKSDIEWFGLDTSTNAPMARRDYWTYWIEAELVSSAAECELSNDWWVAWKKFVIRTDTRRPYALPTRRATENAAAISLTTLRTDLIVAHVSGRMVSSIWFERNMQNGRMRTGHTPRV
jgi:uncharacterized protein (TIGR02996 family)